MNMHSSHKLLPINKEEELKKENITLENSTKEFNTKFQKITKIKKNIEIELEKIDKIYEKVDKEITNSFRKKHEKLISEENNLKEKLKDEVTKVKEKLEKFFSECSSLIKLNEKISKGLKSLEKDEEKNIIKILSYLSKINKNKKEMEIISQTLMRNVNINYEEEKNNIKFEEYFFSGIQIPIPKEINYKCIKENSIQLNWKIDNIKLINLNSDQIKYKVEAKKDDSNDKFSQVYEGKENNCLVENMNDNFDYEFRICCLYNDLIGAWSQIYKFIKPIKIESSLIKNDEENNFIIDCIGKKNIRFKKLYKLSEDGDKDIFHKKCDNKGPTLCLFKIENKDIRYGGFASVSWDSNSGEKKDENAFIFSINNKKMFKTTNSNSSIFCSIVYGPFFGGNSSPSKAELWFSSKSNCGFYNTVIYKDTNKECTQGLKDFSLDELEVFKIKGY